jgi:hypothetical protein
MTGKTVFLCEELVQMSDFETERDPPSAWELAREYGIDVSALETNLSRTPAERIEVHRRALQTATQLARAVEEKHGRA